MEVDETKPYPLSSFDYSQDFQMIQCPECSKDIAENAAHCGHCGAKVPAAGTGMKTMFGFGAISPEMMKEAAAEVAAAKDAATSAAGNAASAADAAFDNQRTIPSPALSLPKPSAPAAQVPGLGGEPSSSVFELNAPGASKPLDPYAAPQVNDIEATTPTVEPGSVGFTPAGEGDPAWADSSAPTAAHAPAPSVMPQASAAAAAMPKATPANASLSNTPDPQMDWGGTGGPKKEEKSKMPFVLIGGCLLLVFLSIFAFVFMSIIWPLL